MESKLRQKSDLNCFIIICFVIHHYWTDVEPLLDEIEMTSIETENENIDIQYQDNEEMI